MDWISLFGRLLLAVVFVVAAIGKLANRREWRQTLADFGLPNAATTPIAWILPAVELAIAALVLVGASARTGALAALILLSVFIVAIVVSLARGRKPDCNCFGQLHSAPVGPSTVLRNVFLAAVAGLVLWQGGANPHITVGNEESSDVAWIALVVAALALAVAAIEAWLLLGVLPQQGRLLMRLEALESAMGRPHVSGLPLGERAPEFELHDLGGNPVALRSLLSFERPLLLFFTNPHCAPCDELLPKVGRWQREHEGQVDIAVISRDLVALNRAKAEQHGLRTILLQKKREVVDAYEVESTPAAILVSADGTIASQIAYGPESIETLLHQALNAVTEASPDDGRSGDNGRVQYLESRAPAVGEAAPALVLPDLEGKTTALANLRGSPTLVLFWSPDCGFCQQLLPELKAWERTHTARTRQVLVVSHGNVESNRAMGLVSPIVLDDDGSAMREFGASGTPMAVLVDAEGRIASSMAAGAQQVMTLARKTERLSQESPS